MELIDDRVRRMHIRRDMIHRLTETMVEIEGDFLGKRFVERARHAIVTLPLGVLQLPPEASGAVRFWGKAEGLDLDGQTQPCLGRC